METVGASVLQILRGVSFVGQGRRPLQTVIHFQLNNSISLYRCSIHCRGQMSSIRLPLKKLFDERLEFNFTFQ